MKTMLRAIWAALAVLVVALGVPVAVAAEGPYTNGDVSLSDASPAPGASVDVGASGFQPNSEVEVIFRSDPITLGSATADAAGEVMATVAIPSDASGEHRIEVVGVAPDGSSRVLSSDITVTADGDASSDPLPSTGSSAAPTVIVALLAALVGVGLLVVTRVRRRARSA